MRIRLTLFLILIVSFSYRHLSAQTLEINDNLISAGYGFPYLPTIIFADYVNEPGFNSKTNGPYYFKIEHIFSDEMSFGLNIAYAANKGSYFEKINLYNPITGITEPVSYLHNINRTTYSLLFRANWYFANDQKFYAFFGGGLGYRYEKWKITSNNPKDAKEEIPNHMPFGFEATMGAKYLLSDIISAYGELGFAKSPIQLGLCIILGTEEPEDRNNR